MIATAFPNCSEFKCYDPGKSKYGGMHCFTRHQQGCPVTAVCCSTVHAPGHVSCVMCGASVDTPKRRELLRVVPG